MQRSAGAFASISEEGRALVEKLGGRWTDRGGMCRCPAHDDRTPSLSVRPGRTRLLLHCFAGCRAAEILRLLEAQHLLEPNAGASDEDSRNRADDLHFEAAARIWIKCRSIAGTPAAAYLAGRGLNSDSPELRYHPRVPYGSAPFTQFRPALVAAVRDDAGLAGIHRTFIGSGPPRLASIPGARRALGRLRRGAVRLGRPGRTLGLAEGIETALSASALFDVPCWATLGTERFGRVSLPAGVEQLLLFLDHDDGGRRAEQLARQAFDRIVRIASHYPQRSGEDWNDVLLASLGKSASCWRCSSPT